MVLVMISLGAVVLGILWYSVLSEGREAQDVLIDLRPDETTDNESEAAPCELYAANERSKARRLLDLASLKENQLSYGMVAAGAGAGALLAAALTTMSAPNLGVGAVGGSALGYIASKRLMGGSARTFLREIEFFLPIVMERIVMAVQSGLDIMPAIERVLELDQRAGELKDGQDPVSRLLSIVCRLTAAGLSFERSLREVAECVPCPALRHAFIHLALAQTDGGELVSPLTELSDSTQLYYQECVEEEIAKMPFKATAPLLCTFAGLIICFLTPPIIQVMSFGADAMPK